MQWRCLWSLCSLVQAMPLQTRLQLCSRDFWGLGRPCTSPGGGGDYPEDLENDRLALLSFRLYYLLIYGRWYRRKPVRSVTPAAREGRGWASWLYGKCVPGAGGV